MMSFTIPFNVRAASFIPCSFSYLLLRVSWWLFRRWTLPFCWRWYWVQKCNSRRENQWHGIIFEWAPLERIEPHLILKFWKNFFAQSCFQRNADCNWHSCRSKNSLCSGQLCKLAMQLFIKCSDPIFFNSVSMKSSVWECSTAAEASVQLGLVLCDMF